MSAPTLAPHQTTTTPRRPRACTGLRRPQPQATVWVPPSQLRFHPLNIRSDLGDLRALTASIASEGVLQPLLAHQVGNFGEVLDGHRRLAAATLAEEDRVPVIVHPYKEPDEAILIMLSTALTGSGLSPEDRRRALRTLVEDYGHTQAALARRLGRGSATIQKWMAEPDGRTHSPHWRPRVGVTRIDNLVEQWIPRAEHGLSADQARQLLNELTALTGPARDIKGRTGLTR